MSSLSLCPAGHPAGGPRPVPGASSQQVGEGWRYKDSPSPRYAVLGATGRYGRSGKRREGDQGNACACPRGTVLGGTGTGGPRGAPGGPPGGVILGPPGGSQGGSWGPPRGGPRGGQKRGVFRGVPGGPPGAPRGGNPAPGGGGEICGFFLGPLPETPNSGARSVPTGRVIKYPRKCTPPGPPDPPGTPPPGGPPGGVLGPAFLAPPGAPLGPPLGPPLGGSPGRGSGRAPRGPDPGLSEHSGPPQGGP